MRDWAVTLLVFIAGLIIAAGGTYATMEKESAKSSVRIEIMDRRLAMFENIINQQNKRLNIAEVRSAKVEEAAVGQTRAVESLTLAVSSFVRSQQKIAVALAGMNERLKSLEERSASLEKKVDTKFSNFIKIEN